MRAPAIVVFSGARIVIVLPERNDGARSIYSAQLSPIDKRAPRRRGRRFSRFRYQQRRNLALGEGADELPRALPGFGDGVPASVDLREEAVRLKFLEVERELRRRVDEVLLEDAGIRDGAGRRNVSDDRATNRVREALDHALEAFGGRSGLNVPIDRRGALLFPRTRAQRLAFLCAPSPRVPT